MPPARRGALAASQAQAPSARPAGSVPANALGEEKCYDPRSCPPPGSKATPRGGGRLRPPPRGVEKCCEGTARKNVPGLPRLAASAKTRVAIPGVARRARARPRAEAWRKRHASARGTRAAKADTLSEERATAQLLRTRVQTPETKTRPSRCAMSGAARAPWY